MTRLCTLLLCAGFASQVLLIAEVTEATEATQDGVSSKEPLRGRPGGTEAPPSRSSSPPREIPSHTQKAVPDRWRIVEAIGVRQRWWDPYHQNTLKGDRPIWGGDWFVRADVVSETRLEAGSFPFPTGGSKRGGLFGGGEQGVVEERLMGRLSLHRGSTTFRPPDWKFVVAGGWVGRYESLHADALLSGRNSSRFTSQGALQEAYVDRRLWRNSPQFDFDSLRGGIQPFLVDFRGFVHRTSDPGIRLYGNLGGNRVRYNVAWSRRFAKDPLTRESELGSLLPDDIALLNVIVRDLPAPGFNLQGTLVYNHSSIAVELPGAFSPGHDVVYFGLGGMGHVGRLDLDLALWWVTGNVDRVRARDLVVNAGLVALDVAIDLDWVRLELYGMFTSGDSNPLDARANGFDALTERPHFAAPRTGYWNYQRLELAPGGPLLSGRDGLIPSLRTGPRSNFVNPGLGIVGLGARFSLHPKLGAVANAQWLTFHDTASLRYGVGRPVARAVGVDLSLGINYRPLLNQQVRIEISAALLVPGQGLRDLYPDETRAVLFRVASHLVLAY